jgi:predicted secreted protein
MTMPVVGGGASVVRIRPDLVLLAVTTLLGAAGGPASAISLPKGEGLSTVRKECTRCHSLRNIANSDGKTPEGWREHVIQMTDIERRPENLEAVVNYLSEHFPPWQPPQ